MKFVKKPISIEAEQWTAKHPVAGVRTGVLPPQAIADAAHDLGLPPDTTKWGWISTLEGPHIVQEGDWIITGIRGERYPCKDEIFRASYIEAETLTVPRNDGGPPMEFRLATKLGITVGDAGAALLVGEELAVPMELEGLARLVQLLLGAGEAIARNSASLVVPAAAIPPNLKPPQAH